MQSRAMTHGKLTWLLAMLVALAPLAACEKYLAEQPESSMEVSVNSEESIAELLTAAYPKASYFAFMETRTDNVAPREHGQQNGLNEAMYNWWEFDQEDLDTPLNYWNECYRGIAHANQALELLAAYPSKTPRIRALYGEAFLLRAYLHFMLVNLWADTYRGEQSKSAPGIPYVDEPEKRDIVAYERGSVYDVYQKIERDLKLGITLVDDAYYAHPKFHFNKMAAYAFASRFYLFKGDWENVVAYATYVVESAGAKIRDWGAYHRKEGYGRRDQMWQRYASVDEAPNLMLLSVESRQTRNLPVELYGMTLSLWESIYNKPKQTFHVFSNSPQSVGRGRYIPKFDQLALGEIQGSTPRDLYVTNVAFSTDEAYLNRMEALVMLGRYEEVRVELKHYLQHKRGGDVTEDDLNSLMQTKDATKAYQLYSPWYGLSVKQIGAVQSIAHFRRQEFMHEGLRWLDIRRFYLPVKHGSQRLERDDPRKTLQLPREAIASGMAPNPR